MGSNPILGSIKSKQIDRFQTPDQHHRFVPVFFNHHGGGVGHERGQYLQGSGMVQFSYCCLVGSDRVTGQLSDFYPLQNNPDGKQPGGNPLPGARKEASLLIAGGGKLEGKHCEDRKKICV